MGIDLRMEPFAEMYQAKRTRLGMLDEFYFQDIDWLFERLGLTWDDYSAVDELDDTGRFPHEAVLKLSRAIETNPLPRDASARELLIKRRQGLLAMLQLYAEWHGNPEKIPLQLQDVLAGRAPGMEGLVGQLTDPRPWMALAFS